MDTKNELDRMIKNAGAKIRRYKQVISDCDYKIDRLQSVYKELSEIKEMFRSSRKGVEEIFTEKGTWRGEQYKAYCSAGDSLDGSYAAYYKRLDVAHDIINGKIAELQAEKLRLAPLIGGLLGDIAKWKAEIKNLVN